LVSLTELTHWVPASRNRTLPEPQKFCS
jgi:hypothetical protein